VKEVGKDLLAQSETGDQLVVSAYVFTAEISKKAAPFADEFQEAELRVMITPVRCHVTG
jgi:hypothetical protein